ncbi:MAG: hypothetical protein B7Y80_21220 [Hyphomicrobium sp. 32-62-53]|nr:MAG: hypothetical protein B7Z29_21135 [Hyphomicrobium sp. 12-62-95]OYX96998.1 MAG: hypothetical protein B7Y80_21220 [Hyphomicrobium sp. 32-62-53]
MRQEQFDPRAQVAILLCTFQAEKFLEDQLNSIGRQTHHEWRLFVSDDGSTDATINIIGEFANRFPNRVEIRNGPGAGLPTLNFLSLACDQSLDFDYFAFCDQDDIWLPHKIERAITLLQPYGVGNVAAYGGRTVLVNLDGEPYGHSPLFDKRPSFQNALVQSIAGGNTIVFNRATRNLLASVPDAEPASHDWWVYQLITGAGGRFIYDPLPTVHYRQHDNNIIGANMGWSARLARGRMALNGRFRSWREQNVVALRQAEPFLSAEAKDTLATFLGVDSERCTDRLASVYRSGVYRQTRLGEFSLYAGALLKCI